MAEPDGPSHLDTVLGFETAHKEETGEERYVVAGQGICSVTPIAAFLCPKDDGKTPTGKSSKIV